MKRKHLALALLAIVLVMFGCTAATQAERDLRAQLLLLKNVNQPALSILYNSIEHSEYDEFLESYGLSSDQAIRMVAAYLKRFDYSIISSEESGDSAIVRAKITMMDFGDLVYRCSEALISSEFSAVLRGDASAIAETIDSVLQSGAVSSQTIECDVHMRRNDGKTFTIAVDEEFINAFSGGGIEYLRSCGLGEYADMAVSMAKSLFKQP